MPLELTFKQVCDFVKKEEPKLIEAVDKLLSIGLICSPLVLGPAAAAALPTLAVKNELIKLGKSVFERFSKKQDDDYLEKEQRMETAYALLCFTAFFSALDKQLPKKLRERIDLLEGEKIFIARAASKKTRGGDVKADECRVSDNVSPVAALAVSFPHPAESLAEQVDRHVQLWKQMAEGFQAFVEKLAFWEATKEKEQAQIRTAVAAVPALSAKMFEAQYFQLARRYEDFAVWSNLQEHKNTKRLIGTLSEYVRRHAALTKTAKTSIDIGFSKLHEALTYVPETLKTSQAAEIVESLTKHYNARVEEPIIEEKEEGGEIGPRLSFPKIRDAFVPQSFRVLRRTTQARRLEDEQTWQGLSRRNDLGPFLLSYLSSPYSTETPLVILGHPGSGKSLLTTIISAQLMSKQYTAIRVPLREVDAEAGIIAQIEEHVRRVTNIGIDSWAKLSAAFKNNPPLVILDGYDELLQASGKVFSGYLKDVQNFQKNETEQGRPVRIIVTSRVTLIDKATIPKGTTIIRLLEFDRRQRDRWIGIWNAANAAYFREAKVDEFVLPSEKDEGAAKILSLAEQPLLLLMLALFDSQSNQLKKSKTLDRTILYDSLLRRFVEREREKDRRFDELTAAEKRKELDFEMQRLGVAAVGMYNRRKLHIRSPELNEDLRFFNLERQVAVLSGRALSQADLLLGSFFFVHKSKTQHTAGAEEQHEEISAFEFLHNTFGEFLVADFILRHALNEVEQLKALKETEVLRTQLDQRLASADGFSHKWFASLVYTPLFTRPVVLEMIREWIGHALKQRKLSRDAFISNLDIIVLNQLKRLLNKREMPAITWKETAQEGYRAPFGDHPLLGHIAIYSINLIVLRAVVSEQPLVFDEEQVTTFEDGGRPWDRLAYLWRSWFALDNLNALTAVITARRSGHEIRVEPKAKFQVAESRSRLETRLNVAVCLGDDMESGVTGLLLYDVHAHAPLELDEIVARLASEKIDLDWLVLHKRLRALERSGVNQNPKEFSQVVNECFRSAIRMERFEDIDSVALSLSRGVTRLFYSSGAGNRERATAIQVFRRAVDPARLSEIASINARAVRMIVSVATEIGDSEWVFDFRRHFMHFPDRRIISFERPQDVLEWIKLARETGAGPWIHRRHPEFFERMLHPRQFGETAERFPEVALAWLQLVREGASARGLQRYEELYFDPLLKSERLWEAAGRNPEAALDVLEMVYEIRGPVFLEKLDSRFFSHLFRPQPLWELMNRSPGQALRWIRIGLRVAGERFVRSLDDEFFPRVFHEPYFRDRADRQPDIALMWAHIAVEAKSKWVERIMVPAFVERVFQPESLSRILRSKPAVFAAALALARSSGDRSAMTQINEAIDTTLRELGADALNELPLSAHANLVWLASEMSNYGLLSSLGEP